MMIIEPDDACVEDGATMIVDGHMNLEMLSTVPSYVRFFNWLCIRILVFIGNGTLESKIIQLSKLSYRENSSLSM